MVTNSGGWARFALVFATLLSVGLVVGCGKLQEKSTPEEGAAPTPPVAENKDAAVTTAKVQVDPGLTKSFADATRQDPPGNWEPIDTTLTGKSVAFTRCSGGSRLVVLGVLSNPFHSTR